MKREARIAAAVAVAGAVLIACGPTSNGAEDGDWPMYRGDAAGTGYSALAEITAANVADLAPAWTYALASSPGEDAAGDRGRPARSQATPIVVVTATEELLAFRLP